MTSCQRSDPVLILTKYISRLAESVDIFLINTTGFPNADTGTPFQWTVHRVSLIRKEGGPGRDEKYLVSSSKFMLGRIYRLQLVSL